MPRAGHDLVTDPDLGPRGVPSAPVDVVFLFRRSRTVGTVEHLGIGNVLQSQISRVVRPVAIGPPRHGDEIKAAAAVQVGKRQVVTLGVDGVGV